MNWLVLNRKSDDGKLESKWQVSFQGQTEMKIGDAIYYVRQQALPGATEHERQQVGTIACKFGPHERFPPANICALFPEFVPAKFSIADNRWEYQGVAPQTVTLKDGRVAMACIVEESDV